MSFLTLDKFHEDLLMKITDGMPLRFISNEENVPYLERYFVAEMFGWQFYIHRFVGSDPDRGLHDHPWRKAYSIVLKSYYHEITRSGLRTVRWFNSLTGDTFHRVLLPGKGPLKMGLDENNELTCDRDSIPCWTFFFHPAGDVKDWGFLKPVDEILPGEKWDGKPLLFVPYDYKRESWKQGKDKRWWLTAKSRRQLREQKAA